MRGCCKKRLFSTLLDARLLRLPHLTPRKILDRSGCISTGSFAIIDACVDGAIGDQLDTAKEGSHAAGKKQADQTMIVALRCTSALSSAYDGA